MSDENKAKWSFPFGQKGGKDEAFYKAVPLNEDGTPDEVQQSDKIKGAAQFAAGTALTLAGVPMLVLPGPGAAAICGGAALALKGHRTMTGREATDFEQMIDATCNQVVDKAKADATAMGNRIAKEATKASQNIRDNGPEAIANAVRQAPAAAASAVKQAPSAAAAAVRQAPEVARSIAENVPVVASEIVEQAPVVAGRVAEEVPRVAQNVVDNATYFAGTAASIARQSADFVKANRQNNNRQ